ncbi:winged helix-turn-helix domain-containing protein [Marinicella sp. W31]|uniref:winged helix-turn-helix domain-containing protein n=1 Tax=Marinicella sp. W31 TaxID=3023713 RepID=UPI0037566876
MIYRFLDFSFNTQTSELSRDEETITLNTKPFTLLKLLVENPNQILDKDFLIDMVWQGRIVSDNTIAQTVAQLRQALSDDGKDPYIIKTYRGRGISFIPSVTVADSIEEGEENITPRSYSWAWLAAIAAMVVIGVLLIPNPSNSPAAQAKPIPLILVPKTKATDASELWLQQTAAEVLSEGLDLAPVTQIRSLAEKPAEQSLKAFIETQWNLSPSLQVVETQIEQTPNGYQLTLLHTNELQQQNNQVFNAPELKQAFAEANQWLLQQLDYDDIQPAISDFLPDDPHILELYMRGLAEGRSDDYEKAENYFELSLQEAPQFHKARIKLADIQSKLGKNDDALTQLDMLLNTELQPVTELEAIAVRAFILDLKGELEASKTLLESALVRFADLPEHRLNHLRFELSYTYTQMNELETALELLDVIETKSDLESDPELFLGVMHKKASLYQYLGRTQEAHNYADLALNISQRMGKMPNVAKLHGLKGRLFSMESNFKKSKHHLFESLKMNRELGDKLNAGAGMNDIIYILIREGDFDQAEILTREMQEIAVEIEYARMLMAAKQHQVSQAIARRNWDQAEQYLRLYEDLAQSSNHQSALTTGYLLRLQYLIEKGSSEGAQELLDKLEEILGDSSRLRQRIALELRRAQILLLEQKQDQGIALLISTKELAQQTEDGETIIEINNILADLYLTDEPQKSLQLLNESENLQPLPYPYLLLKSKALAALGKTAESLEYAVNCKRQAGDWWQREDEAYLSSLNIDSSP